MRDVTERALKSRDEVREGLKLEEGHAGSHAEAFAVFSVKMETQQTVRHEYIVSPCTVHSTCQKHAKCQVKGI